MSKKKDKKEELPEKTDMGIFVALDLGATEVRAIAARKDNNGNFETLAVAVQESKGIQRGAIHNTEEVKFSIKHVITDLENAIKKLYNDKISDFYDKIDVKIEKVYVALNGSSIKTVTNKVCRRIGGDFITQDLIEEFNRDNRCVVHDSDLEIIDIQPLQYLVDDEETASPIGCRCEVIQGTYKIILGKSTLLANLRVCLESLGLQLAGYCVAPQATANACLSGNEKELGVVMLDFGASTTNLSIYYKNKLHYSLVIPIGSDLITKDIAQLRIVHQEAEKIKIIGHCHLDKTNPSTNILVGLSTGNDISYHIICDVIERRIDTILGYVKLGIEDSKLRIGPQLDQVVLMGNGCQLKGLEGKVQETLGLHAHKGRILEKYANLVNKVRNSNSFATVVGTLLTAKENCAVSTKPNKRPQKTGFFNKAADFANWIFEKELPEEKKDGESK